MKIAIHQPNFLPWMGYFYKMANSDIFVFLDDVQYEKNSVGNRNKIKTPKGPVWITLPVKKFSFQPINKTELINFSQERKRIIKTLKLNYQRTKYFDFILPELENILLKDWQYLAELNIELIKLLRIKIGIKTKLEIISNYNILGERTDLLINICKSFNADTYLSGEGGRSYQDEEKFKMAKINLEYSNFIHPIYSQRWGKFIPNLSIIDLLFNCGPDSLKILLGKQKT
jgi:hypothetical protein